MCCRSWSILFNQNHKHLFHCFPGQPFSYELFSFLHFFQNKIKSCPQRKNQSVNPGDNWPQMHSTPIGGTGSFSTQAIRLETFCARAEEQREPHWEQTGSIRAALTAQWLCYTDLIKHWVILIDPRERKRGSDPLCVPLSVSKLSCTTRLV